MDECGEDKERDGHANGSSFCEGGPCKCQNWKAVITSSEFNVMPKTASVCFSLFMVPHATSKKNSGCPSRVGSLSHVILPSCCSRVSFLELNCPWRRNAEVCVNTKYIRKASTRWLQCEVRFMQCREEMVCLVRLLLVAAFVLDFSVVRLFYSYAMNFRVTYYITYRE